MSSNEDIKNGNGLKPLGDKTTSGKPSGITTEQRENPNSGIRKDNFTKQKEREKK